MAITPATSTVPAARKQTLATAYIDFADGSSGNDW